MSKQRPSLVRARQAERSRPGDHYPGITHPAVAAVACPTCDALAGVPCRTAENARRAGAPYTRTHRRRLNVWRIAQQSKSRRH